MLPRLCQTVASAPLRGRRRGRNLGKDLTFQKGPNTQMACTKKVDYTLEIVKQVSVLFPHRPSDTGVCGHNIFLTSVFDFTTTADDKPAELPCRTPCDVSSSLGALNIHWGLD